MSVVCKQCSANKAPQFVPKMHETVLTAVFPKCTKIYLPAYLKLVSDLRNRQLAIKNRDGDKAGRNFVFWVNLKALYLRIYLPAGNSRDFSADHSCNSGSKSYNKCMRAIFINPSRFIGEVRFTLIHKSGARALCFTEDHGCAKEDQGQWS